MTATGEGAKRPYRKRRDGKNHKDGIEDNLLYTSRYLAAITNPENRATAIAHDTRCAGRGVSSGGRKNYAYYLKGLDEATKGKPWGSLTGDDLSAYMAAKRLAGYSDATLLSFRGCITPFLKFALKVRELPYEIADALKITGLRRLPERPVLTKQEEEALLAACGTLRDQAFIKLLIDGGFRVNEQCNLDVGGLTFTDDGGLWVSLPDMEEGLKTGWRKEACPGARPLVEAYLSTHPGRDDKT